MLNLNAKEWKEFEGGYKLPYDVSIPLRLLESSDVPNSSTWKELFENLYHQGDVGIASYAAIPHLLRIYKTKGWIDFNLPSLASTVEEARNRETNPKLPDWLFDDYFQALEGVAIYCLHKRSEQADPNFRKAILMLVAILLKAKDIYDLLDFVRIGDEEKMMELYDKYAW